MTEQQPEPEHEPDPAPGDEKPRSEPEGLDLGIQETETIKKDAAGDGTETQEDPGRSA